MSAQEPTHDEVLRFLRVTEARLEGARAELAKREAALASMSRGDRRTDSGRRLTRWVLHVRATVETLEGSVAHARAALGEGPAPERCFRTMDGKLRCVLPFNHAGLHLATTTNGGTRRWE